MQRVCFTLQIKKDRIEDYLRAHQVWPEMEQAMRDVGVKNYSMFIDEDGLAVGYFESEDPEKSLEQFAQTDVNRRWQAHMSEYFESDHDTQGPKLQRLNQYFYLK